MKILLIEFSSLDMASYSFMFCTFLSRHKGHGRVASSKISLVRLVRCVRKVTAKKNQKMTCC